MRPGLPGHRARSHRALLDEMAREVRRRTHGAARPWDPARPESLDLPDFGRGLLDTYALALHVLWTYQQAWSDEGFLPTARLPASVRRLLELIGYHPDPGFAASGLQHFRCKEGTGTTLPPGFRVKAPAAGDVAAAVFETRRAIDVSPALNELRPFLPPAAAPPPTAGAVAGAVALNAPEVQVPQSADVVGATELVDQLGGRLAAARAGSLAQRNAARARQKALRVAEVLSELQAQGAADLCGDAFDQLCQELCEAQSLANQAADVAPGPLSESQELLIGQLRGMAARQPKSVGALGDALARQDGESDESWSARLDQITGFLDALVAGILQEARDQVVRLHGTRALSAMDRAFQDAAAGRGVAPPGTDSLYLLPGPPRDGRGPASQAGLLRPGDWLVVAEDLEQTAPAGPVGLAGTAAPAGPAPQVTRVYREAVEVLRVRDEIPPGLREPATRVTFAPPLARRYRLDRTVLLGNVVEISHGAVVVDELRRSGESGPFLPLSSGPLTWLRASTLDAPEGRVPEVELTVAGQPWTRVTDLRGQRPGATAFAVEITPEGGSRVRVGDGLQEGGAVPDGTRVSLRYRTGIGTSGNRGPAGIDSLASANPAVVATFNPLAVSGGVEPEGPDLSKAKARAGVHVLDRAISVADVRSLALTFGGVRHAAVLRDPVRRRDHVTVVVVGEGGAALTDPDRARLRAFLVSRMPPGASVAVANRDEVGVRLRLVARVEPGFDPLEVVREARVRLGVDMPAGAAPGLLHPDRADLGQDVRLSDVYGALAGIPRLASAFVEQLYGAGAQPGRSDRIQVAQTAIAVWARAEPGLEPVEIAWEEAKDL
jgi:hypothetical protein